MWFLIVKIMAVKYYFNFFFCLLTLNCFAQNKEWKNEGRHSIGISFFPVLETILIPGCIAPNIAYGYQIIEEVKIFGSLYYSEKNENSTISSDLKTFNIYTKQAKLGLRLTRNQNLSKNIISYLVWCIGYTENNLTGNMLLFERNYNQSALFPYRQKHASSFFEFHYGLHFKLNKNFAVSTALLAGVKSDKPAIDWPMYSTPGLGTGRKSLYYNFQVDLWFNFKNK